MSRNLWEKMNGYPSRFGTARRDAYGRLLPGEYNGRGEPLGSHSAPDLTLSQPHDWSGFDDFFHGEKDKPREKVDNRSAGGQSGRPRRRDELAELNRDFARRFAEANRAMGAQSADGVADGNSEGEDIGAPDRQRAAPGERRSTSYGSVETKDPVTGRWVGSVRNPPPANGSRMGGEDSPAGPRLVRMKPIPKPLPTNTGNRANDDANSARNFKQNQAMYGPGGMTEPVTWDGLGDPKSDLQSSRIQGMLNDAATPGAKQARDAIATHAGRNGEFSTPYGRVAVTGFKEPPVERFGPPVPEWFGPPAPMSDRAKALVNQVATPLPKTVEPARSAPMTMEKAGSLYANFKRDSTPSSKIPAKPIPFTPSGVDPGDALQGFIALDMPPAGAPPKALADAGDAKKKKYVLPE